MTTPTHSLPYPRLALMLAAIWLAYMLSFFHRFAPSGIAGQLTHDFNTPATALGILAGVYFYVYTLMQIPAGVILDVWGPKMLLLWGGVLAGLGSVAFGFAPSLGWAMVARIVVGLGVSVTFLAMLKVYALVFPVHRFSTMVGIGLLLGNIGSMLAGIPLASLAAAVNWRFIFFGLGVLSFCLGLLSWWVIPEFKTTQANQSTFAHKMAMAWQGLMAVVKNPRSWPPTLVNGGVAGCLFGFGGLWITPWLREVQGITAPASGWVSTLYFLGFALGSLGLGRLSDHLRRRKTPMIIAAFFHFLLFVVIMLGFKMSFFANVALMFALGFMSSAFTLTWASIKELNSPALSGTSTSFANMAGFLVGGILQAVVGKVLDIQANLYQALGWSFNPTDPAHVYHAPIATFVLLAAIAFLASFWVTETHAQNTQPSPQRD